MGNHKHYVVMGATGLVGQTVARVLLRRGQRVTALGRDPYKLYGLEGAGAAVQAQAFGDGGSSLARVLKGAEGAFLMIPRANDAGDMEDFQDSAGKSIAWAVEKSRVHSVVHLSSIGAQHAAGTGPLKALHRQERRLDMAKESNVLHFRAAFFMQNFFESIGQIRSQGVLAQAIHPHDPLWMVAAEDVGERIAELLLAEARGHRVYEFAGPTQRSMREVALVLGRAIGKPDLQYVQLNYATYEQILRQVGMSETTASLMTELQAAQNSGRITPEGQLRADQLGTTTLETFAAAFAASYKATLGDVQQSSAAFSGAADRSI